MSLTAEIMLEYAPTSIFIESDKLTSNLRSLLEFTKFEFKNVIEESLLISSLSVLSQIALYGRLMVKVKHRQLIHGETTFCNLYTLSFLPSGEGKDAPINFLLKTFGDESLKEFKKKASVFLTEQKKKLEDEANEKFKSAKSENEKYVEMKMPHTLIPVITDGTPEGLTALRSAFENAGFGGVSVRISEFKNYILSENNARQEFLSLVGEIYDSGNSKAKVTKGDRVSIEVENVPMNFFAHTTFNGLLTGKGNIKLKELLNTQFARRCLVCFPELTKYMSRENEESDPRVEFMITAEIPQAEIDLKVKLKEIFSSFSIETSYGINLSFSEPAEQLMFFYQKDNLVKLDKLGILEEESIRAELKGRSWKATKLSGIIAAFEHPLSRTVEEKDVACAIYITDFYGRQFSRFFFEEPVTPEDKIFKFLFENAGKWVSLTTLRDQRFVGVHRFSNWFKAIAKELTDRAEEKNLKFLKNDNPEEKNQQEYMISLSDLF